MITDQRHIKWISMRKQRKESYLYPETVLLYEKKLYTLTTKQLKKEYLTTGNGVPQNRGSTGATEIKMYPDK